MLYRVRNESSLGRNIFSPSFMRIRRERFFFLDCISHRIYMVHATPLRKTWYAVVGIFVCGVYKTKEESYSFQMNILFFKIFTLHSTTASITWIMSTYASTYLSLVAVQSWKRYTILDTSFFDLGRVLVRHCANVLNHHKENN